MFFLKTTSKNIDQFQKEVKKHAIWGEKATDAFKKWYKMNQIKKKYNCTKEDIERFRREIGKRLLYHNSPTKAFKKWLYDNKRQ